MKDLTVILEDRPGTLADAFEALGKAGVNVSGTCGFPAGGEGILHVLVEDGDGARKAIEKAGLSVRDERDVVMVGPVPDQAGEGGRLLRRIANQGVNVDLLYFAQDGRVVMSGDDVPALERAARS